MFKDNQQLGKQVNTFKILGDIYVQDNDRLLLPFPNIVANIEAPITNA